MFINIAVLNRDYRTNKIILSVANEGSGSIVPSYNFKWAQKRNSVKLFRVY